MLMSDIRWSTQERRDPLKEIVKHVFPTIQSIANNLVSMDTIEAAEMLKLALKIYHAGIQVRIYWYTFEGRKSNLIICQ